MKKISTVVPLVVVVASTEPNTCISQEMYLRWIKYATSLLVLINVIHVIVHVPVNAKYLVSHDVSLYRARRSRPFRWSPWDLWDRKIWMGFNAQKVIIFWSQSFYVPDYTYVACGFKWSFFMQRKQLFIMKKFDNFRFCLKPLCELKLFAALDANDIRHHHSGTGMEISAPLHRFFPRGG